ncbi:hypothetical protein CRG98_042282, partial [Punica granatum]
NLVSRLPQLPLITAHSSFTPDFPQLVFFSPHLQLDFSRLLSPTPPAHTHSQLPSLSFLALPSRDLKATHNRPQEPQEHGAVALPHNRPRGIALDYLQQPSENPKPPGQLGGVTGTTKTSKIPLP